MIIRSAEAEFFHADRQKDMTKLLVLFLRFCESTYESNPYKHLDRSSELQKFQTPGIYRQSAHKVGKVVTHRPSLPSRRYPWYSFLLETESTPQSEGLVGMSMKISNDAIGNRSRDLPACNAVMNARLSYNSGTVFNA